MPRRGGRGREPLERTHEHRELEVDGSDAIRACAHARAIEHRPPLDELGGAGAEVPRPSFGALGLELEEILRQRPLEPCECGLDAIRCAMKRCLARTGRRRNRVSPPPALEQPAERERGRLAGAELRDEPAGGQLARGVALDDGLPAGHPTIHLDHDGEHHGPAPRAVVHDLPDGIVDVLLEELDLGHVLRRQLSHDAIRFLAQLDEELVGLGEATCDQLRRRDLSTIGGRQRRHDDEHAVVGQPTAVAERDVLDVARPGGRPRT